MNLQYKYQEEMVPKLKDQLGLSNVMAVPKLEKVTINVGAKEALGDKKILETISQEMMTISGQKPVITKAKK